MDSDVFLQQLRDLPMEEGRAYIQYHIEELSDHSTTAKLLEDEALRVLYSPFLSLKIAELLIFYGDYTGHLSSHALGLKAEGDVLRYIGHHQAAMDALDSAGEEFLSLGDECNWARSRISWILACAWLGNVDEALQHAVRAREVFLRYGEYYWVCIIDHNTAVIYDNLGRYQDALKLYENMLVIYPTVTDQDDKFIKRAIALAEMNIALDLALLGDFEKAHQLQQHAQDSFVALGEASQIINSEINLADFDYTQGYYGSALRRYYQALDRVIQHNVDDPLLLAELKLWMANCLVKLNRAQEACHLADEAVAVCRQLGTSLQASNALREYATTLLASGRSMEALAALVEAEALFTRGGFHHYASTTTLQQAELLLEMGRAAEAYDLACLIRKYFESQGLAARFVRASMVMAAALLEKVRQDTSLQEMQPQNALLDEAMLLCKQAAKQAHQHNLQEEFYKSHYLLGQICSFQGNFKQATKHFGYAIIQIEHILDDLVYDLSPSFLHTTWRVYEDMIALCLSQSQIEHAFNYLERARSMALRQYLHKSSTAYGKGMLEDASLSSLSQANSAMTLRIQRELKDWQETYRDFSVALSKFDISASPTIDREVIQQELKRCEAKISELFERLYLHQSKMPLITHAKKQDKRKKNNIDIARLRSHLSPGQLLLAYFLFRGKLVIFAITKNQLITHENPEGVEQLERLLPLLHAHLQPEGWFDLQRPPQQAIRRLLGRLYDLLVAPIASLLPPSPGSLTIVPYGPLHELPFHALYNGSHFLIEDFQISYLPASNILTRLDNHKSESGTGLMDAELFIKPPLVFGYSEKGHLQRVSEEAKIVASLLNGQCYIEDEATITRLIEQAPGCPVIHLATHGQNRLDAPNFSSVRLADGQLNAIDAFSMDLKRCELVTLSGCETGLALSGGGDEQLGLGRAFLAAGADSLVMSLWQVEDNSTSELMQLFYNHLLKGEDKVQALRTAQCQLLHQTESIYTHPYFWAAFRLVGEVGPLKYKRVTDRSSTLEIEPLKNLPLSVLQVKG